MDHFPPARLIHLGAGAPDSALRLSPVLTETAAVSAAERDMLTVVIRRHRPYILLGPSDRRLPGLDRIRDWAEARGLPAFIRIGGGSLVWQDAGTISFGVARKSRDLTALERNFRELGEGVLRAFRHLGLENVVYGRAAGSYCEGPWDMVVDGVKIAGVAQAIRGGFALVSGMILVNQDPVETTRIIEELYELGGSPRRLRAEAVTNLERLLGHPIGLEEVERALLAGFESLYQLTPSELDVKEWSRAARLYHERRLA